MKTFRMIGMVLVAMMLSFTMGSCDNAENDEVVDPYKDYPQLIVGKWFNFTPDVSLFVNYGADGSLSSIGYDKESGWLNVDGTYSIDGNVITYKFATSDGSQKADRAIFEVTEDTYIVREHLDATMTNEKVHYRVQNSFDIKGNYSYLNSVARVVPAEGKTALQLPEGVTFNGQSSISIDAMHAERIIAAMQKFFADATFADGGKLNHQMDGETKEKSYTHNGNNLTFDLYEGGSYKVNATTFPDEDGDRLFIIIPKQAAWLGGMVDLVEKENEGLKLDAAQLATLEKEFMDTFDTFTVILSLSKK
ncbi:MAG: hypothetical protein IKV07_00465 [Bacteroidaceae bacterium]|nr:hypothetical protein [Bacteroidaceae bacterium]